jgi:hypothetical protein
MPSTWLYVYHSIALPLNHRQTWLIACCVASTVGSTSYVESDLIRKPFKLIDTSINLHLKMRCSLWDLKWLSKFFKLMSLVNNRWDSHSKKESDFSAFTTITDHGGRMDILVSSQISYSHIPWWWPLSQFKVVSVESLLCVWGLQQSQG